MLLYNAMEDDTIITRRTFESIEAEIYPLFRSIDLVYYLWHKCNNRPSEAQGYWLAFIDEQDKKIKAMRTEPDDGDNGEEHKA